MAWVEWKLPEGEGWLRELGGGREKMGGQTSFLTTPRLMQRTEPWLSDRQALFRSQGFSVRSLLPVSPPTEPHLVGACSLPSPRVCCPSHMATQRWGALEPAGRRHSQPPPCAADKYPQNQSCPLENSTVRGRKGHGVQLLMSWTPQPFPSRGTLAKWHRTSSPWEGSRHFTYSLPPMAQEKSPRAKVLCP